MYRIWMVVLVLYLSGAAGTAAPDNAKIASGQLKGAVQDGVVSFKGIPYAAPPVGDLRWRPPQPAKPWTGVRPAAQFGSDCMQLPFPSDAAPLGTKPAEDCLFVNVWAPAARTSKLPVMLWIYGGGFVNGGSSPAVYDGSQFAKRGVVCVSFNYRLGRFGFFAHPALTAENPSGLHGNYGYMDQIAALEWVQKNIAQFGGDPSQVTIFGESAGGGSVHTLMTSPLARGLFHRAIVESGGGRGGLVGVHSLTAGEVAGVAFAKSAGIAGEDSAALAALRKLPADSVVAGLNMATMMMTSTYIGPLLDGKIVVEPPDAAYLGGRAAKVPLLVGANSSDIGFMRAKTMDEVLAPFGVERDRAKAVFDPQGTGDVKVVGTQIAADEFMVEPARFIARTVAASGQTAYEFRFSYVAESMRKQWHGAPHATEIPFVFDTLQARYGMELTALDKAIAAAANAYWANFAKTGNPNGDGLPDWPAYSAQSDRLMDFTAKGPVAQPDLWKTRLDLVEGLVKTAGER